MRIVLTLCLALGGVTWAEDDIALTLWRSVVQLEAATLPDGYPSLAARTIGLYMASNLEIAGATADFEKRGRRIRSWYWLLHDDGELDELRRFRMLQLADNPVESTVSRLRGIFGVGVVDRYLDVLAKSPSRAYRIESIGPVRWNDRAATCEARSSIERFVMDELDRQRREGHSYVIPMHGDFWRDALPRLADVLSASVDGPVSLALRDEVVEGSTLRFDLGQVCGTRLELAFELAAEAPVPVVLPGDARLADELVELNRLLMESL